MSPKLAKLYKTWNTKLKKSGFEDIEQDNNDRELLKRWHGHYFRTRMTPMEFEARQTYFYMAEHFATNYEFKNKREQTIWTMHATGSDAKDIAKRVRRSKSAVQQVINKLKEIMLRGTTR